MKLRFLFALALLGVSCVFSHRSAFAVTFTNNTTIGLVNLSHDGSDIVVSNCTVTVDGPHAFASLLIAAGGVLTHTSDGTGSNTFSLFQADEPQLMVDTNLVSLVHSNVYAFTIEVWNTDKSLRYANGADYVLTADAGGVTWLARTMNSAIPSGTNVLVSYGYLYAWAPSRVDLTVAGDVTVVVGGAIRADGRGYSATSDKGRGSSAGSPASGGGGGNAGGGGTGSTNSVGGAPISGSFQQPTTLGGTGGNGVGGNGGKGGGGVLINCGGTLTLNGEISANGANATNSRAGGGAGGSVWLVASNFAGAGAISANGGAGEPVLGGGGGGGRIAIQCTNNTFGGSLTAIGALGWQNGGAGTVFTKVGEQNGLLLVDNAGRSGTNTQVTLSDGSDVMVSGRGILTHGSTLTASNVTVASDGAIRMVSSTITALGDFTIQTGGMVHADGTGTPSGLSGGSYGVAYNDNFVRPCGGGAHAGAGGSGSRTNAVGGIPVAFGQYNTPSTVGYAGASLSPYSFGGAGGGVVRLNVNGTLQVDGRISANGLNGSGTGGGGGAGGSVYLTAGTLAGNGQITANGGNGVAAVGGGGGGGRVAVYSTTNVFSGPVTTLGGGGTNRGGAGTVYLQPTVGTRELIIDNGGVPGSYTLLPSAPGVALNVRGAAIASSSLSLTFGSATVGTNSWIWTIPASLTVSGNLTVESGGGIAADEGGYLQNQGPGYGRYYGDSPYYTYPCGGGGFGGYGGNGSVSNAAGGLAYDISSPYGSGGGGFSSYSIGGAGGGSIWVSVSGTLHVDGAISANGGNGSGSGGGGGSGGKITITTQGWTGNGVITANGGNGAGTIGGGGGGGRISITYGGNSPQPFNGSITAFGGGGANWGGAGTIYQKWNSQTYGRQTANNADHKGANTLFDIYTPSSAEVTISGGASVVMTTSTVRNLLIRSNSALTALPSTAQRILIVSSNAIIEPGAAFTLDGAGYGPALGTGVGSSSTKGGGGHGGFGAGNSASSGSAYGLIQAPATAGSGGGNGSGSSIPPLGGAGGGALKLTVSGVLQVDGKLSVNGANGDPNSGGGSGGSLWLLPNQLTGTGVISANGGAGMGIGGGGGGGRISISWNSNSFTGPITASGGAGNTAGGAGTVYLKANNEPVASLLVANGGLFGTNTPLGSSFGLPTANWNLAVESGAVVHPVTMPVGVSNIFVGAGGTLTSLSSQTNLYLATLGNLTIAPGGTISVDGKGYLRATGPGSGQTISSKGAGGGYGGGGGASASGAVGGTNYGSATKPVDRGSGGGSGLSSALAGSDGGGAIRLAVSGTLTVDGLLSAGGAMGLQDDSGGGAGGSIWATANTIAGAGVIAADGGDGDLYGGGGGGGGRIAIYANNTNAFTGGVSVWGGDGASAGQNGTIVFSTNMHPLEIISQSPSGIVSNVVGFVDFNFSSLLNPATVSTGAFALVPPTGSPVPATSAALNGAFTARLSFTPSLNVPGDYTVMVNQGITDVFGAPLSQIHTGAFTIALPTIQGTVSDAGGGPVAGAQLQPDGGFLSAMTDQNGHYALGVPPGWNGTVTPTLGTYAFEPGSLSYSNVTATLTNQNYLLVTPNIVERIYALTTANQLISFDSTAPGKILSAFTVMGLQANEQIVGIDFWNGTLYGLGNLNHLYTINRANGAAGLVGSFSPVLNGQAFGLEAEPAGLRVVSELDQDLLLAYATGAATNSATINGSPNPNITGLAYSSGNGQLYAADYFQNTIGLLDPASGLVTTIGPAGIDFSRHNGFDISPNLGRTAYLASPAASSDPAANLYKINLASGSATLVGLVGLVGDNTLIRGLSVAPGYTDLTPANVIINATGNLLTLSWPADRTGWRLETQTNTLATGLGTNWFTVSGSAATNQVSISIGTQNDSVFFRLVYP